MIPLKNRRNSPVKTEMLEIKKKGELDQGPYENFIRNHILERIKKLVFPLAFILLPFP